MRAVGLLLALCAACTMATWLVLNEQSGPCNVDDFTGCSALGEIAVFAFLVLVPATAALALIAAVVFVAQRLRSKD